MYAIYIITNSLNGKQYVGITNDIERRWRRHKGANEGQFLHRAIKKHGAEAFVFTHFADAFDADSAKAIERMLIVEHNTMAPHGYNLTQGGDGTFGRKHTEATKEKIKASNKKTWDNSPALKKAIGVKNALLKTGVPSPLKGKPSGRKGVPHSAEHAANLKTALNTPESKEKRSKAAKIALNDPAWKAAQSARVKAIWAIRKAQKETA
jgi:group I intron endonuclease